MAFHPVKFALIACIAVPAAVVTWSHKPAVQAKPPALPQIHYRWIGFKAYCGIDEITAMQAVIALHKEDSATLRGLLYSGQVVDVAPGTKVHLLSERDPVTHVTIEEGRWVNKSCWVVTKLLTGGEE